MAEVEGTDQTEAEEERVRLEALSREILEEDAEPSTPPEVGDPDETTTAPAEPQALGEPQAGTEPEPKPGPEKKLPGWQREMPESLRGRLEGMTDEEVSYLRNNAENGLRQADYSRQANELPSKEQIAMLLQSHQALEAIRNDPEIAVRMFGKGDGDGQPGEEQPSVRQLAAELMEHVDPDEFANTLERMLTIHGESVKESLREERASSPESKAEVVNAAAARIREALGPDYPDEAWQAACSDYVSECERNGTDWRDTPPTALPFLLKPYLRLHRPSPAPTPTPEGSPAPRAAAMPASGGPGPRTTLLTQAQREGREESEDEIFDRTLAQYNLTEQGLAKLRSMGE